MFQAMLGIQTEGNGSSAMYLKEETPRFLGDPGFCLPAGVATKMAFNTPLNEKPWLISSFKAWHTYFISN